MGGRIKYVTNGERKRWLITGILLLAFGAIFGYYAIKTVIVPSLEAPKSLEYLGNYKFEIKDINYTVQKLSTGNRNYKEIRNYHMKIYCSDFGIDVIKDISEDYYRKNIGYIQNPYRNYDVFLLEDGRKFISLVEGQTETGAAKEYLKNSIGNNDGLLYFSPIFLASGIGLLIYYFYLTKREKKRMEHPEIQDAEDKKAIEEYKPFF